MKFLTSSLAVTTWKTFHQAYSVQQKKDIQDWMEKHEGEMMTEFSFLGERMLNHLPRTWTQSEVSHCV